MVETLDPSTYNSAKHSMGAMIRQRAIKNSFGPECFPERRSDCGPQPPVLRTVAAPVLPSSGAQPRGNKLSGMESAWAKGVRFPRKILVRGVSTFVYTRDFKL